MLEDCAIRFTDFDLLFVVVVDQLTSDPAAVFLLVSSSCSFLPH